jgi:ArsR family transcriptional regulator
MMDPFMRDLEIVLKAAGDPTRTRILKLLEPGELCVCQIQAVLGLAFSTVSRHLAVLKSSGLVEDRRDGRWIHYAQTRRSHNPFARGVLDLLRGPLDRDSWIVRDRRRLRQVLKVPVARLCAQAPARRSSPAAPRSPHRPSGGRGRPHV